MILDIDMTRYVKVARGDALAILEQAKMIPDDFTAHRNGSFTARYLRDRTATLKTLGMEERIENIDPRVAIFKRPSDKLDRGRYVTFKFAVASTRALGLPETPIDKTPPTEPETTHLRKKDKAVLDMLTRVAENMQQLVDYAQELVVDTPKSDHMTVVLDEIEAQVELLRDGLTTVAQAK